MVDSDKTRRRRSIVGEEKLNSYLEKRQSEDQEDDPDNEETRKARLRRTNSVSNAQVSAEDTKKRRYQPDRPIHQPRDSLLSWSSGFTKYEGLVNNCFLILLLGGSRLFLENVIKYGFLVNPLDWFWWFLQESRRDNYFHTPLWLLGCNCHLLFAFQLEKYLSQQLIPSWLGFYLHAVQLVVIILAPWITFVMWPTLFSLLGRMVICTSHTLLFLKLWSYVQVNHWCRDDMTLKRTTMRGRSKSFRHVMEDKVMNANEAEEYVSGSSGSSNILVRYPANLTLKDLYYFVMAPTLCYELNFPRTSRIRKWFLCRRAAEVIVLSNILLALIQQWMIPSVKNSMKPFSEMDFFRTWERLLKLSIPNHLLWMTWFYLVFHSFLNTVGELMMFADRKFYSDWWNARDVGTFWRLWNLPVHKWAVRHLYVPVLRSGRGRTTAGVLVFLLSAFLHEYSVSVPLGMYKIMVFLGMALQVPLVQLSSVVADRFGNRWGNVIVWASLILGQPLGILVYFYDYAVKNVDIESMA